jgi:hypothetical protein
VKHELIVAFERSEEPMANKHAKISIDCQLWLTLMPEAEEVLWNIGSQH